MYDFYCVNGSALILSLSFYSFHAVDNQYREKGLRAGRGDIFIKYQGCGGISFPSPYPVILIGDEDREIPRPIKSLVPVSDQMIKDGTGTSTGIPSYIFDIIKKNDF